MAWVLLDDNFPNHPKAVEAGPVAAYLYVSALCYCRRFHTGGFVPAKALPTLGVATNPKRMVAALVDVGLWDAVDGGFQVHDYDGFYADEDDKAMREAVRQQKREAGRRGGVASGQIRASDTHGASRGASSTGGMGRLGLDHLLEEKKRDADFANFWVAYPKKDGKQAALAEWRRLKLTDEQQQAIGADLDRRRQSTGWIKSNGQFIPHARTYLHQRRWEDGFEEAPTVSDTTLRVVKGGLDYASGE
jgi:hypothetical protein